MGVKNPIILSQGVLVVLPSQVPPALQVHIQGLNLVYDLASLLSSKTALPNISQSGG